MFETNVNGAFGDNYKVEIEKGKSIRVMYTDPHDGKQFDKTFSIGDYAEYDSYNLSYYGRIVSITEKTVTIEERYTEGRKHRLNLQTFCWRNYDFDLERTSKENAITSQFI